MFKTENSIQSHENSRAELLPVTLQGSGGAVGMEGEPRMVGGELLVAVESRICSWNLFAVTLVLSVQQQQQACLASLHP